MSSEEVLRSCKYNVSLNRIKKVYFSLEFIALLFNIIELNIIEKY